MKTKEEIKTIIYEGIGQASMCWSEDPKGVFDEKQANEIAERILSLTSEKDKRIEALENAGKLFLAALAVSPKDWLCTLELIEAANVMDKTLNTP